MVTVALTVLVTLALGGCAASSAAGDRASRSEVRVTGDGKVTLRPDTALVQIGAEARAPSLTDATADVARRMTAVLSRVKSLGVDEKDIGTVAYTIDPLSVARRTEDDPARIVGYRVRNVARLTVRDLGRVGTVIDAAVSAGANTVPALQFTVADPARAEAEARALAVRAAAVKAGQMADAAGVTVGELISLTEGPSPRGPVEAFASRTMQAAAGPGPVEPGQLEIHVTVEARYRVAPASR